MPVAVAKTVAAIDELIAAIDLAGYLAVTDGAILFQATARASAPKESGQLAASISIEAADKSTRKYGMTGVSFGAHAWSRRIGPKTIYGRIAALGGPIPGRGKFLDHKLRWENASGVHYAWRVHHPSNRYMLNADDLLYATFRGIAARRWSDAIESVA
jgi:hypothetical protein